MDKQGLTFLGLPLETQNEIFSWCPKKDLVVLSLVSQHFRALAAAQLYRKFHIDFPDDDDQANAIPIDRLSSRLETFATSDYNYAQHLRSISLDTFGGEEKPELAYKSYFYPAAFANTLFLLTLRKAKALDSFK
jgi:hypothetical protein